MGETEIVIPKDLKAFLNDIVEQKHGFSLGEPWRFSEESLLVMVPILRKKAPKRSYMTMYEAIKDIDVKDTGCISQLELQNKTGKPIFVRAGTIFTGKTQNRATQHSGVYKEDSKVELLVRCVHQTHGISSGAEMKFGSIAPLSITTNLMMGNQSDVWNSVRVYTSDGNGSQTVNPSWVSNIRAMTGYSGYSGARWAEGDSAYSGCTGFSGWRGITGCSSYHAPLTSGGVSSITYTGWSGSSGSEYCSTSDGNTVYSKSYTCNDLPKYSGLVNTTYIHNDSADLLGYLNSKGKEALDEMMQTVPLFDNQVGALIFNQTGLIAIETFDHPRSWESIKQEIIQKYGDKVKNEEAEHLFDINKDRIGPLTKKFISALDNMEEKVVRQDDFSETRSVKGNKVVGEYTLVKGRTIHCLLVKC